MLLLSYASNIASFFLALLVISVGASVWMAGTGPATMANWFVRKRGTAIGLILAGISLGSVFIPGMVWAEQHWGWPVLARIVAASLLVVGVPASLVLRHRPEQYGLRPDGDPPDPAPDPQGAITGSAQSQAASPSRPDDGFTVRQALKTRALWALILAQAMTSIGGQAATLFFIPHLEADAGISPALAAVALTATGLLGLVGQPVVGWLSDISRRRLVLGVSNCCAAASIIIFALIKEPWHLVLFVALYGLTARTGFPVLASILADYFGRANFGKIQGFVLAATALSGTVSALLVAAAFDAAGSYVTPFLVLGGLEFLSVGFLIAATRPRGRAAVAACLARRPT
jgi:MFS family permease